MSIYLNNHSIPFMYSGIMTCHKSLQNPARIMYCQVTRPSYTVLFLKTWQIFVLSTELIFFVGGMELLCALPFNEFFDLQIMRIKMFGVEASKIPFN